MNAPSEPIQITVRDGAVIELRRIRPEDKSRLVDAFDRLSPNSRYRRFMSPIVRLAPRVLRYLTEIDQHDHIAWGAVDPSVEGAPGLGVARCVRLVDEPTVAEAAVTVVDSWHGRGVGTALLTVLAQDAAAHGITAFRGYVLPDNTPMRALLSDLGGHPEPTGEGTLRVDLPLPADARHVPQTAAGQVLRAIARSDIPGAHNPFTARHGDETDPAAD